MIPDLPQNRLSIQHNIAKLATQTFSLFFFYLQSFFFFATMKTCHQREVVVHSMGSFFLTDRKKFRLWEMNALETLSCTDVDLLAHLPVT